MLQKPWKARDPWPIEAADTHYLIGQCHMELHNFTQALDAFTDAIKLNPNMAEVGYGVWWTWCNTCSYVQSYSQYMHICGIILLWHCLNKILVSIGMSIVSHHYDVCYLNYYYCNDAIDKDCIEYDCNVSTMAIMVSMKMTRERLLSYWWSYYQTWRWKWWSRWILNIDHVVNSADI